MLKEELESLSDSSLNNLLSILEKHSIAKFTTAIKQYLPSTSFSAKRGEVKSQKKEISSSIKTILFNRAKVTVRNRPTGSNRRKQTNTKKRLNDEGITGKEGRIGKEGTTSVNEMLDKMDGLGRVGIHLCFASWFA